MRRADGHKRMKMLPDILKEPQCASNNDPSHRMANKADFEPPIQYLSHLRHLYRQSLAATVNALLSLANVRNADVNPKSVVDL